MGVSPAFYTNPKDPVKEAKLRRAMDESTAFLKHQLLLNLWHVSTYTDKLHQIAGQCHRRPEYKSATITLDHHEIRDADEAREFLRHELLHLVFAPMMRLEAVEPFLDKRGRKLLQRLIGEVEHEIIHHVEAILDLRLHAPKKPKKRKKGKRKRKKKA